MIDATEIDRIIGSDAVDQDDDRIGRVSQVYLDSDSERPTWATVRTGLFGTSETLVPLSDASWDDGSLRLAVDRASVKGAPRVDPDAELSVGEQQRLYRYYGFTAEHLDDEDEDDDVSYSRSDVDTSDLDAGLGAEDGPDEGRGADVVGTGVVGTAADRTIEAGRRTPGPEQPQQGEPRLRRYIAVEGPTRQAPQVGGTEDAAR